MGISLMRKTTVWVGPCDSSWRNFENPPTFRLSSRPHTSSLNHIRLTFSSSVSHLFMWFVKSVPVDLEEGTPPTHLAFAAQEDGIVHCVLPQLCSALHIPDSTWKGWIKPLQVVERDPTLIRLLRWGGQSTKTVELLPLPL